MKQLAFVTMMLGVAIGAAACTRGGQGAAEPVIGQTAAAETLVLTWQPPAIGQVATRFDSLDTRLELTDRGQPIALVMTKAEQTQVEVVEVTPDGAVARLKVRYQVDDERQTVSGQTQEKPSPVEGKTYLVWREGDAIRVTREDGAAVSAEEQARVADDEDEIGKIPGMATLLVSRPWKTSEVVVLTAADLTAALGPDEDMTPTSGKLTLTGVDGGVATFALEVAAYMQDPQGKLDATMQMTIELDIAQVRPIAIQMTGTVDGKVGGMSTAGTMSGAKTFAYR